LPITRVSVFLIDYEINIYVAVSFVCEYRYTHDEISLCRWDDSANSINTCTHVSLVEEARMYAPYR